MSSAASDPARGTGQGRGPGRRRVAVVLVPLVALLILAVSGLPSAAGLVRGGLAQVDWPEDLADADDASVLEETWDVIRSQYVAPDTVDEQALVWGAASGLVDGLGDTGHSRFLDPEGARDFQEAIDGDPVGIGVRLLSSGDLIVIYDVVPDGPADEAGILPGDAIVSLAGDDVTGLTTADLDPYFDGIEGNTVTLGLFRPATGERFERTLAQTRLDINTVTWAVLPGDVGLLRVAAFDAGTAADAVAAISAMRAEGVTALVLDLRNNPGGLVNETVALVSQFLPAGETVVRFTDRDGNEGEEVTADGGTALDLPLTVLVNRRSASAAEITAAALRDSGRATVLGQTTYGTGTILYQEPLDDGSVVVIGRQLWLTPAGETVWRVGLAPDAEVLLDPGVLPLVPASGSSVSTEALAASGDAQLAAALETLGGEPTPAATPATGGPTGQGMTGASETASEPDALAVALDSPVSLR